jgi:hypothetical protein
VEVICEKTGDGAKTATIKTTNVATIFRIVIILFLYESTILTLKIDLSFVAFEIFRNSSYRESG